MRTLIVLHRWLGVAFCLLFATWFASGIVMHFVPFPQLTETARFAGWAAIDLARVKHGPAEALRASGLEAGSRIRLVERSDGPVYLVSQRRHVAALHAADLSDAAVTSAALALAIAADYARRQGSADARPTEATLSDTDQWSMQGELDAYRPLYRIALHDRRGTELYVSARTGEVVQQTTRRERLWNYAGSIPHWLYFTALRSHPVLWGSLVWWLSLLALLPVLAGGVVGVRRAPGEAKSRYRGFTRLHHWLGLSFGLFVLSWAFSGWLSLNDGLPFLAAPLSSAEKAAFAGNAAWPTLAGSGTDDASAPAAEVEWFAFDSRIYRRERLVLSQQTLRLAEPSVGAASESRSFLSPAEIDAAASRLGHRCDPAYPVPPDDDYAPGTDMPGAPVYRVVCGSTWYDVDAANGTLVAKLDGAGRAYRWLYAGLHKLDIPPLRQRPLLRTATLVGLCLCGLAFSLTGVVLAWRRLTSRAPPTTTAVTRGLDPRVHPLRMTPAKKMDCRVKPGNDFAVSQHDRKPR